MAENWTRLGELVRNRRVELGLTQAQVQERGGPSPALVRSIETGRAESMSRSKRRDLERSLHWRIGSVDDILAGGDPAADTEQLSIPNINRAGPGGDVFEVSKDVGGFEPIKLFALVLIADALSSAADDFKNGEAGPDRLIALAHKTYHASVEMLADALEVDPAEARATVKRLGYMFEDTIGNPDR
ncbi:helix-turn-helix domain-containing protein [Nocardia thailandica]|uniref:Helix-turn-helix domain-containing protein n=1 Tax=Nocardia thailandica TaxID=257275 RepID=A0ABW6PWV0_9NOCA